MIVGELDTQTRN